MKFNLAEPKKDEFCLALWESENKVWSIRLDPVMYGCRARITPVEDFDLACDYCAGSSKIWQQVIVAVLAKILEPIPESATRREIEAMLPRWVIRPMVNDPRCWEELCKLAGVPCIHAFDDTDRDDSPHAETWYRKKLAEANLEWNGVWRT